LSLNKKYGAFFAFSTKQFEEAQVDGVKYANAGGGLVIPTDNVAAFVEAQKNMIAEHKQYVLDNYTVSEIVQYELGNHEAGYTGEIEDTVDAVACFGITAEQVQAEFPTFMSKCAEMDMF